MFPSINTMLLLCEGVVVVLSITSQHSTQICFGKFYKLCEYNMLWQWNFRNKAGDKRQMAFMIDYCPHFWALLMKQGATARSLAVLYFQRWGRDINT